MEYNSDKIDASIGVDRFQVLQDENSLIVEPYNKKPEVTFNYQDNNELYFVNLNKNLPSLATQICQKPDGTFTTLISHSYSKKAFIQ